MVEAILKIAARRGKRFPDEEVMRQRCKDAYEIAKNTQQTDCTSSGSAPILAIDVTAVPWEVDTMSRCVADDVPAPAGSVPEPGSATSSVRRRRATYAVLAAVVVAALTVTLILLLHPALLLGSAQTTSGCLDRPGDTSWGVGEIHVCVHSGQGSYSGYTRDKEEDDYCVRWRIDWDDKPDSYTPEVCLQQGGPMKFNFEAPAGVSGIRNAFLERVKISSDTM
ncbi:MAG: hypothetical protein ACRDSR_27950 [Pseudonocardiaceae bacterium]